MNCGRDWNSLLQPWQWLPWISNRNQAHLMKILERKAKMTTSKNAILWWWILSLFYLFYNHFAKWSITCAAFQNKIYIFTYMHTNTKSNLKQLWMKWKIYPKLTCASQIIGKIAAWVNSAKLRSNTNNEIWWQLILSSFTYFCLYFQSWKGSESIFEGIWNSLSFKISVTSLWSYQSGISKWSIQFTIWWRDWEHS